MNSVNENKIVMLRDADMPITEQVATEFLQRGATVLLADMPYSNGELLVKALSEKNLPGNVEVLDLNEPKGVFEQLGGRCLDAVIHLYLPNKEMSKESVRSYVTELRTKMDEAFEYMTRVGSQGIVVNQFVLPTMFADHLLADCIVEARSLIDAYGRTSCIRYGEYGIRTLGIMLGLLDHPAVREVVSERVNNANTPLGRWINVEEVAKTLVFLGLDSSYMSGQSLVFDGGMTGGCNGV